MQAFHASVQPDYEINKADCEAVLLSLMDTGFVGISESGFIAGLTARNPLNQTEIRGKEFLWWAADESGAALLRAFRAWCRAQGATKIDWSCPHENSRVKRFYSKFANASEAIYTEVL